MLKTLLMVLFCTSTGIAQNIILSGYVQDTESGEKLIGASLYITQTKQGISTNKFGFFSASIPSISSIEVSYLGYTKQKFDLRVRKDSTAIFQLKAISTDLSEVIVKAEQTTKDSHQESSMGRYNISVQTIKKTPALLGENDLLKTLQLLPGVQAGSEGTVGLNVRGSTPDQNLVLLDGIPVYNINHLFGFLSIINSDAIANAEFLKGSMPARYGGRLASVLDIRLREGNLKKWQTNIGLSPIASKLTIEGSLKRDKSSILISMRRTWLDALLTLGQKISKNDGLNTIGFYDMNAKWNYIFSEKNRLYFSFYTGQDKLKNTFQLKDANYSYGFNWGNQTLGSRWNHLFSQKLFGNLLVNYTNFSYKLEDSYTTKDKKSFTNQISSGIQDVGLKYEFDYFPSNKHAVKFGTGVINHTFKPEIKQFKTALTDTTIAPAKTIQTWESYGYIEDDFDISTAVRANVGVHYANQIIGSTIYHAFQPRFSMRVLTGSASSVKAAYTRTTQFLHLLTNSSAGLPTDLWVPVTTKIPPEYAENYSVGYAINGLKGLNFSIETYYKNLHNVLEYKEGTNFLSNPNISWEDRVSIGNAKSYGIEFFVEKTKGKSTGWLSYTLSKTDRVFTDINEGVSFPFKYDRRHNIAFNGSYDFNKRRSISCTFIYTTGMAVNLAAGRFESFLPGSDFFSKDDKISQLNNSYGEYFKALPDYNGRNSFRTPGYHRLDISYKSTKQKNYGTRTWTFGVYNVYSRQNPFFLFYDQKQLLQFSLLPAIPSFTYSREF